MAGSALEGEAVQSGVLVQAPRPRQRDKKKRRRRRRDPRCADPPGRWCGHGSSGARPCAAARSDARHRSPEAVVGVVEQLGSEIDAASEMIFVESRPRSRRAADSPRAVALVSLVGPAPSDQHRASCLDRPAAA